MNMHEKIEEAFGYLAPLIVKLKGHRYDIPEALACSLQELVEFGLWHMPYWYGADAKQFKIPSRTIFEWIADPQYPHVDERFVYTAIGKVLDRLPYDARYAMFYQTRLSDEAYRIAHEAHCAFTVKQVLDEGLVRAFCEEVLTQDFAKFLVTRDLHKSYGWVRNLADFLIPAQIVSNAWRKDYAYNVRYSKELFEAVDACVLDLWGDDAVVAKLRHDAGHCAVIHGPGRVIVEADPRCRECTVLVERRAAQDALIAEAAARGWVIDHVHVRMLTVEDVMEYRAELENPSPEDEAGHREDSIEDGDSEISENETSEADPFIEEVVDFVTQLIKLGVTPNKAADAAAQLLG